MDAPPPPSARLIEAAVAEHDELSRYAERLIAARDDACRELESLERDLAEITERQRLLAHLAKHDDAHQNHDAMSGFSGLGRPSPADVKEPLRGPQIRQRAVALLLRDPDSAGQAIHYREWYGKLIQAGYEVLGKDPLAVFLTQVSRSPAVCKTNQPGIYRLDLKADVRLKAELVDLDRALREIGTITSTRPEDVRLVRSRRAELGTQITHTERALEEVVDLFDAASQGTTQRAQN